MEAETLPAVHQADLAQASGKGALCGFIDAGVAELVNALDALSVGAQEAEQSFGVQDIELAEVLVNLQMVPGQPAHKGRHRRSPGLDRVKGAEGVRNRSATGFARRVDG